MQLRPDSPFQSVTGLGAFKCEYFQGGRGRWVSLGLALLMLAAAPAVCLLTIYLGFDAYERGGLRRIDDAVIFPAICSVLLLVIGAVWAFSQWRSWNLAAALYENGVAYNSRQGVQQVAWNDIDEVYQAITKHYTNGVYTGTTYHYTLKTRDGKKLVLDNRLGKGIEELGREVQRGASQALFPRYWQALQSGQRVNFGPLGLDRDKLYAGKKELPWSEIKAIRINKGIISVKRDKGWFNWASATVPQIPNFYIFYDLVGRFAPIE